MDNRKFIKTSSQPRRISSSNEEENKRFSFRERKKPISYKEIEEDYSCNSNNDSIISSYHSEKKIQKRKDKKTSWTKEINDRNNIRKLSKVEQLESLFQWENKISLKDTNNLEGKIIKINLNDRIDTLIKHHVESIDCILVDIIQHQLIVSLLCKSIYFISF